MNLNTRKQFYLYYIKKVVFNIVYRVYNIKLHQLIIINADVTFSKIFEYGRQMLTRDAYKGKHLFVEMRNKKRINSANINYFLAIYGSSIIFK